MKPTFRWFLVFFILGLASKKNQVLLAYSQRTFYNHLPWNFQNDILCQYGLCDQYNLEEKCTDSSVCLKRAGGPFWANRGKRDPVFRREQLFAEEPHWIYVRRQDERGNYLDYDPFFVARGKKATDFGYNSFGNRNEYVKIDRADSNGETETIKQGNDDITLGNEENKHLQRKTEEHAKGLNENLLSRGKKDDPFFISRGKKENEESPGFFEVETKRYGPFFINRGRKADPFFINRGKKDDPFFIARGRKDFPFFVAKTRKGAPFFITRGRKEDPFFIARGRKLDESYLEKEEPFFISRGRKDICGAEELSANKLCGIKKETAFEIGEDINTFDRPKE